MKKILKSILVFSMMMLLTIDGKIVGAMEGSITKIDPNANVLVIFSTEDWEIDENIRLLDLTIGHFSDNVEYINVHNLEETDIEEKTHLFYYGHVREKLPPIVADVVSVFEGDRKSVV